MKLKFLGGGGKNMAIMLVEELMETSGLTN